MQSFYVRLTRYANTWLWLIRRNLKLYPTLLLLTVFLGVSARLSTILGFVASVKSAVWVFQPDTIPALFYEYLPVSQQIMFGVLILVPGLVFAMTGQFRYLQSNFALRLQTKFSNHLAYEILMIDFSQKNNEELNNVTTYAVVVGEIKKNYAKLFAIETMLLDLLILAPVIIISLLIGLFINWLIVSVIMCLGFSLIVIFIWKRHHDRNSLEQMETTLREVEAASVSELTGLSEKNLKTDNHATDVKSKVLPLIENISIIRGEQQRFRYNSDLIMDLGQSIIVVVFLSLLLYSDIQSMQVQYLVILALLFRFIISYGKAIVQAILKLSPFYKFVVVLQQTIDFNKN